MPTHPARTGALTARRWPRRHQDAPSAQRLRSDAGGSAAGAEDVHYSPRQPGLDLCPGSSTASGGRMQGPHASHLIHEFAQLSRTLAEAPDEDTRLQIAVSSAVSLMDGCDHAGFTVNLRSGLITRAASPGNVVSRANELQQELGEGPCLDALRDEETIISRDLSVEPRWPRWASLVHRELGVGSMMSLLVYTEKQRSFGALSLYAEQGHRFEADDWAIGQALAGHISVILTAEREIDQLGIAVHTRTSIGQAQGILMERLQLNADQAFDFLRRVSSIRNRKLADVAEEIARTREVPDLQQQPDEHPPEPPDR
ncbi:antitermination regulator [Nocardioides sp. S5]|nr:antitermination regulator [Nocardioides sp. S5]